ncbi:hypothetical protein HYX11_01660 [Candidatus Woesearchaeota archaeon]|nr:hypothetical protein [Candidatus Woesearchaeota archaeon]
MSLKEKLTSTLLALSLVYSPFSSYALPPSTKSKRAPQTSSHKYFRIYEPLLEKVTKEKPVPANHVFLMNTKQLHQKCKRLDTMGCYTPNEDKIYIEKEVPPIITNLIIPIKSHFPYKCKNNVTYSDISIFHLWVWLHEQGHHFDRQYNGDKEVFANTFALSALEYLIGTNNGSIDSRLLNLTLQTLHVYYKTYLYNNEHKKEKRGDYIKYYLDSEEIILALLALPSINSLKTLHRHVQFMPLVDLRSEIYANLGNLNTGAAKLEQLVNKITDFKKCP